MKTAIVPLVAFHSLYLSCVPLQTRSLRVNHPDVYNSLFSNQITFYSVKPIFCSQNIFWPSCTPRRWSCHEVSPTHTVFSPTVRFYLYLVFLVLKIPSSHAKTEFVKETGEYLNLNIEDWLGGSTFHWRRNGMEMCKCLQDRFFLYPTSSAISAQRCGKSPGHHNLWRMVP
jgi:hypothetical protein